MPHSVVLFKSKVNKEFSITARKPDNARLDEIMEVEQAKQFEPIVMIEGVTKEVAQTFKHDLTSSLKQAGYTQVTR